MPPVRTPVHGVDLGQVTFELPLRLHGEPGQSIDPLFGDIAHCIRPVSKNLSLLACELRRGRAEGVSGTYGWCQRARPSCVLCGP